MLMIQKTFVICNVGIVVNLSHSLYNIHRQSKCDLKVELLRLCNSTLYFLRYLVILSQKCISLGSIIRAG